MSKKILIAGEGGQGIQALAKILVKSAHVAKKKVAFLPNFGIEQRGGVSLAFVQISTETIPFPKFKKADYVVVFSRRALIRVKDYLHPETIIIFDNSLISEVALSGISAEKVAIPASYVAKEKLVPKVFNIIMLGALVQEIGTVKINIVEKELQSFFAEKFKKEPQLKHFNLAAFEIGLKTAKDLAERAKWHKQATAV